MQRRLNDGGKLPRLIHFFAQCDPLDKVLQLMNVFLGESILSGRNIQRRLRVGKVQVIRFRADSGARWRPVGVDGNKKIRIIVLRQWSPSRSAIGSETYY